MWTPIKSISQLFSGMRIGRSRSIPRFPLKHFLLRLRRLFYSDTLIMSRRPSRRNGDDGSIPFIDSLQSKTRSSPLLSIGIMVVGAIFLVGYMFGSLGGSNSVSKIESGVSSCTAEIQAAFPYLVKAYGDSMHKVLHVGPDTCSVVSSLLKEENIEAWGIEPYELQEDIDNKCKTLVQNGIVRVANVKFPLPYRAKSFSLVIVSDTLDYFSPKYVNKTLPELARVSADGIVVLSGYPDPQRAKVAELSKFGRLAKMRSSSWWIRLFTQIGLEENESVAKKFEQAATKKSYKPGCQIFHLKSSH